MIQDHQVSSVPVRLLFTGSPFFRYTDSRHKGCINLLIFLAMSNVFLSLPTRLED